MRRISALLAFAAILLAIGVGYTYKLRSDKAKKARIVPTPHIETKYESVAPQSWHYEKDDPQTNKPIVRVEAKSFQATNDPSSFELQALGLKLYNKDATSFTYVKTDRALFEERSGVLNSQGAVTIVMNVPTGVDPENSHELTKRVRVQTSGITYETKTGKASTDQRASFVFSEGDGEAVGGGYDPNTHILRLNSKIALDWVGNGPPENKMHIETGDLVYNEQQQKIYLSPWSKLHRQSTTIQAQSSVVTLLDGRLRTVESDHPVGTDNREDRHTDYSADKMTALFDDDGNLVQIIGEKNARVVSGQPGSRTTMTGERADLRFAVNSKQQNGKVQNASDLHLVLVDGHAVAESVPQAQPGVQLAETRILRSEHIELEMKPGGQDVQEIRSPSQAQLEFKPNRPEQSHRIVDASHLRVVYGSNSYVDTFLAWNVATHTDKPASDPNRVAKNGGKSETAAPALTWSDQLIAKFSPDTNQVSTIEQTGNFRYQEASRKAWARRAVLEQTINRITLTDKAHVLDDTGSAMGDRIVMNQATGDMDAFGHVLSTHAPDRNQKPGTSMLDDSKPMQAKADTMLTRENNSRIHYQGNAVMWQGANRISADAIDLDREQQSLHAVGNVVSELMDEKASGDDSGNSNGTADRVQSPQTQSVTGATFTVVEAPELFYRDDTRIALYTGGVKLIRGQMTVTSKQIQAFLTPKSDTNKSDTKTDDSSLDHAIADGDVAILQAVGSGRTRTGSAQHCEYYTKNGKVVLNGGAPQMLDSYKGITRGQQLTYYTDDDHLIVEGEKKQLAYTQMRKK